MESDPENHCIITKLFKILLPGQEYIHPCSLGPDSHGLWDELANSLELLNDISKSFLGIMTSMSPRTWHERSPESSREQRWWKKSPSVLRCFLQELCEDELSLIWEKCYIAAERWTLHVTWRCSSGPFIIIYGIRPTAWPI